MKRISAPLFLVILSTLVLGFLFNGIVSAQKIDAPHSILSDGEYAFQVGALVARSRSFAGCSIYSGKVLHIVPFDEYYQDVHISIVEVLAGEPEPRASIIVKYKRPDSTAQWRSERYSPWIKVSFQPSSDLLFGHCEPGSRGLANFFVSDKTLFPDIRRSIKQFKEIQNDPTYFLKSASAVNPDDNLVKLGFLTNFAYWKRFKGKGVQSYMLGLSILVDEDKIPDSVSSFVYHVIGWLLIRRKSIEVEAKTIVIDRVVRAAIRNVTPISTPLSLFSCPSLK